MIATCPHCGAGRVPGEKCYQCKKQYTPRAEYRPSGLPGDIVLPVLRAYPWHQNADIAVHSRAKEKRIAGNWLTEELSHVSWARDIEERHCTCGGRPTLHFAGCPRATSHRDAVMPADGETLDRLGRFYDCIRHIGEPDADYRARILELISLAAKPEVQRVVTTGYVADKLRTLRRERKRWLEYNGQTVHQAIYPELAALLMKGNGNTILADHRPKHPFPGGVRPMSLWVCAVHDVNYFPGMGSVRFFRDDPNEESIVPPGNVSPSVVSWKAKV